MIVNEWTWYLHRLYCWFRLLSFLLWPMTGIHASCMHSRLPETPSMIEHIAAAPSKLHKFNRVSLIDWPEPCTQKSKLHLLHSILEENQWVRSTTRTPLQSDLKVDTCERHKYIVFTCTANNLKSVTCESMKLISLNSKSFEWIYCRTTLISAYCLLPTLWHRKHFGEVLSPTAFEISINSFDGTVSDNYTNVETGMHSSQQVVNCCLICVNRIVFTAETWNQGQEQRTLLRFKWYKATFEFLWNYFTGAATVLRLFCDRFGHGSLVDCIGDKCFAFIIRCAM